MRTTPPPSIPRTLAQRLASALRRGDAALTAMAGDQPVDERDGLLTLLTIHDLHVADIEQVGPAVQWQHHPTVAELKVRLEQVVLSSLAPDEVGGTDDPMGAIRAIARDGLVPEVYEWLAEDCTWDELVAFLALEGGPDAGFDDLVAACQIGLHGEPKLELARNYWDEMGRGEADEVHTELHHRLSEAIRMPRVPRHEQPTSGLRRTVLGSVLATNRVLQPEMVGALGLLELQAGPRCRKVVRSLERLDAPEGALPFYVEHATVDPHHGKAWLDHVVAPLGEDPRWAEGMVRGARWRAEVNAAFFADMAARFVGADAGRTASTA
jgi:hypothetical protein